MMNADDIKKGIECMKAQKKSLEKEITTWEARSLSPLRTR